MVETLKRLNKYGQRLDLEIAKEMGLPLDPRPQSLARAAATGAVITCSLTRFENGKQIDAWQCRVSGYVLRVAPRRARRRRPPSAVRAFREDRSFADGLQQCRPSLGRAARMRRDVAALSCAGSPLFTYLRTHPGTPPGIPSVGYGPRTAGIREGAPRKTPRGTWWSRRSEPPGIVGAA